MREYTITIKTDDEKNVLKDIISMIALHSINISYVHLFVDAHNIGTINLELEDVKDIEALLNDINTIDMVRNTTIHSSSNEIYGKRIVIIGGGAQVSQVALGAITEADRHNIRGERIGVDTIPLVGEENIAEAVDGVAILPRVKVLVLAGSLMGGEITNSVKKLKEENDIVVISLNMPGSVPEVADLVITDPIQAGVMAVMAIANTAVFDVERLKDNNIF